MSISKFTGHTRSTKVDFSATVLTFDLKAKTFGKLKTLLSERFGGNCVCVPHLTAVCGEMH